MDRVEDENHTQFTHESGNSTPTLPINMLQHRPVYTYRWDPVHRPYAFNDRYIPISPPNQPQNRPQYAIVNNSMNTTSLNANTRHTVNTTNNQQNKPVIHRHYHHHHNISNTNQMTLYQQQPMDQLSVTYNNNNNNSFVNQSYGPITSRSYNNVTYNNNNNNNYNDIPFVNNPDGSIHNNNADNISFMEDIHSNNYYDIYNNDNDINDIHDIVDDILYLPQPPFADDGESKY